MSIGAFVLVLLAGPPLGYWIGLKIYDRWIDGPLCRRLGIDRTERDR